MTPQRRFRPILVALLIAWHGLAVLGGPALHGVPGFGHAATLGADDLGLDAAADPGCPVCLFAAQGAVLADAGPAPAVEAVGIIPADEPPPAPAPAPPGPSRPRAPPLG